MTSAPRYLHPQAIVATDWLAANLNDPKLRIFDCTTYLLYETVTGRPYRVESGRADYDKGHIPNSGFLDLQGELSDGSKPTNFMMPPLNELARRFAAKGIGDDTRVILYSRKSIQWATRVWWMLRAVGFDNAAILDGGIDKWIAEGRQTVTTATVYPPAANLTLRARPDLFCDKETVKAAIGDGAACTINALAPDLHSGENPRYGRPGRIPGSVNVPAAALLSKTLEVLPPETVAKTFAGVGADKSKRIVIYCGGGIAATLDAFLLHQLGYDNLTVYDASMSEWAKDASLPVEVD